VEERLRGEDGYCDWCLVLIDAGLCSCDGCGGHLEHGTCLSCGCGHHVQEATRHTGRRYPAWFPVIGAGRCAAADASREVERREQDRLDAQRRRERAAGK
jgi:hypothetical protein